MDFDTFWQRIRRSRRVSDHGLVIFRRIPSSHGVARRAAGEYQIEGNGAPASDFLAWQQTAGQGRNGRSWESPPGAGVYASVVRQLENDQARALPLTVPVALASALRDSGIPCGIKWPNDLLIGDKKLGGVLIDTVTNGDSRPIAVISFGVNHAPSRGLHEPRAIATADIEASLTLDQLAAALLERLDSELARVKTVDDVLHLYRQLIVHREGDALECRLDSVADQVIHGHFLGVDERGLLRLRVDGKEQRLSTGRLVQP